ncbi:HEAT repeat domain-containing protein [Marinomonas lutimaris]|uniref:HEAT repeat domain-containing protein n=1 Tax=Marinomonas lutimaris TaxID=2846746 RepID=UPI001CA4C1AA|nr:HEAT repeat domain-containing protein [Marinomonas lutimaris]
MSGGISAIKGFDYQATVILDILFEHFDRRGPSAQARPEGIEDLDLSWTEGATEHRQYFQIKKPTEKNDGNLNPKPWTLSSTVKKLLPNAITNLSGNGHHLVWVVGDVFENSIPSLINSDDAPTQVPQLYWEVIHCLAKNYASDAISLDSKLQIKIQNWKIPSNLSSVPEKAISTLQTEYPNFIRSLGVSDSFSTLYSTKLTELHNILPNILTRIEIRQTYGSEQDVSQRVYDKLIARYSLQESVIKNTLFRNLRGFINDISKQAGRSFGQVELEIELRCVWPQMIPIKKQSALDSDHVARRDIVERFTKGWTGKAIEAIGISGSGKTTLTSEIAERSRLVNPERLVYYAEVRSDICLRDVLSGIAFHLRRQGIVDPFSVAITNNQTEEELLVKLARSYSIMPCEVLFLIDLVEGTCSTAFARDLAIFIRALSPRTVRVAVFGQESALREMTSLEKEEHEISRLDIRGFNFEEFTKLAKYYHPNSHLDWTALIDIYERVTVGKASGLFAKLAQSLARSKSIQSMRDIADKPAEDMLAYAEQKRFSLISDGAQSAAIKLICFALPFQRKDAEDIFPDENIGMGIRELLSQGLLSSYDNNTFEMHETVRAGLEGMIAKDMRNSTHLVLAAWYGSKEMTTTEIFHLEKAGKFVEAQERARNLFLSGNQWLAIYSYITRQNLISIEELIRTISNNKKIEHIFLLANIIKDLDEPIEVSKLFNVIYSQPQRYFSDYQWSSAIVEAILEFDQNQLHTLIVFSINSAVDDTQAKSALGWLDVAVMRKGCVINSATIKFFNSCSSHTKNILIKILLRARHREALSAVFKFMVTQQESHITDKNRSAREFTLYIENFQDTVELLAAIPRAEVSFMLISKSVLLGDLTGMIWPLRKVLRKHCIEILTDDSHEEIVLENAIRVLFFLAEPSLFNLIESITTRKANIRSFATLLPVLQPAFFDSSSYQTQLFDLNSTPGERFTALSILAYSGEDLSSIYKHFKLVDMNISERKAWDFMFLMICHFSPFLEAIELLEKHLATMDSKGVHLAILPLTKLGELPNSSATQMLTRALIHSNPEIRKSAVLCLSKKRSRKALPALVAAFENEKQEELAVLIAAAIVASGTNSALDIQSKVKSSAIKLWQSILIMRLRDVDNADELVRIAIDPQQNWQLRRSAILAAGRLPYNAALDQIVSVIMEEDSPLTIDQSANLRCHSLISSVLSEDRLFLLRVFEKGKKYFIGFFAELLKKPEGELGSNEGFPSGTNAADWLYTRLSFHGFPTNKEAPNHVFNEVNIPLLKSAILRSLRLCRQPKLIEQELAKTKHIWISMKCLIELRRAGDVDVSYLRSLVDASPCQGSGLLNRVIDEMNGKKVPIQNVKPTTAPEHQEIPSNTYITYDDAVRALSGNIANFELSAPLVFKNISSEQCEHLIRLSDPVNDNRQGIETYIPMIRFKSKGHVVASNRTTMTGSDTSLGIFIRPAVAAANSFGLTIPWLNKLMAERWSKDFVKKYLMCLCVMDDSSRFYEELSKYEDVLIEFLCDPDVYKYLQQHIDTRITPTLMRYVASGTDKLFEELCKLTLKVNTPEIDPVLNGLLYRWSWRFDKQSAISQHDMNTSLWRGFRHLTEHPRFDKISDWMHLLEQVLKTQISWFHADDIVRVLERDPRSYILIESRLFKAENWEHFYVEEVDKLDTAADRLFSQLLET